MGNWRTVHIQGTCDPAEVPVVAWWLRLPSLDARLGDGTLWDRIGPLTIYDGLCGLHEWVQPRIDVIGNLFERDYSVEQVAEHLRMILQVAPSLKVMIDCGGDWESTDCEATIIVGEDGSVAVLPPRVESIMP